VVGAQLIISEDTFFLHPAPMVAATTTVRQRRSRTLRLELLCNGCTAPGLLLGRRGLMTFVFIVIVLFE